MPTQNMHFVFCNASCLQVGGEFHTRLLCGESGDKIHQGRGQGVVGLQTDGLELRSNLIHALANDLVEIDTDSSSNLPWDQILAQ